MKKRFVSMIVLMIILVTGSCHAASYTLPEKMYNQLSIGSGLKGSFTVTAEGGKFRTPFLNAVTDAEWSVRGIRSGEDLHYYVFQSNEQEQQSAVSELYRKDGIYYFRSDMVQGRILAFPVLSQVVASVFPDAGENGSASSFIANIIALPEKTRKEKWDSVLQRYQNQLELWLADFTVTADTVRLDNGLSALDFTYEIPMKSINEEIVKLYGGFSSDPEVTALLDTVMSEAEKKIYMNGNLLYFYLEALQSLQNDKPVRMSKRVSAIGDLLRFSLELPLDERTTGYRSVDIQTVNQRTVITLRKTGQDTVIAFPETSILKQNAYEQSIWFSRVDTDAGKMKDNISVRIDVKKTNNVYEKDEKTHETNHYDITVQQDTAYLPSDTDLSLIPEYEKAEISIDLHYSSKYAQNSATTLEITADIRQSNSQLQILGKLKTAAPWLFMPFEVIDPVQVGTEKENVLEPYLTDWISNAESMIHHNEKNTGDKSVQSDILVPEQETESPEKESQDAETAPLDVPEQQ